MIARVVNLFAGTWLMMAPQVLGLGEPLARWNDWIVGFLVVVFAAIGLTWDRVRGVNVVLGTWMVLAPFVLGYAEFAAIANDVVVGLVVFFLALVPTYGTPAIRRGWLRRGEPGAA